MEPFATVEQYEARYGEAADRDLLAEVLMDVTRLMASELERSGIPMDAGKADLRMQVCRSAAYRAMGQESSQELPIGATQYTHSAGVYSESVSIGNPYRDVYLTKSERRLLGIGRGRIGFVGQFGGYCDVD